MLLYVDICVRETVNGIGEFRERVASFSSQFLGILGGLWRVLWSTCFSVMFVWFGAPFQSYPFQSVSSVPLCIPEVEVHLNLQQQ